MRQGTGGVTKSQEIVQEKGTTQQSYVSLFQRPR